MGRLRGHHEATKVPQYQVVSSHTGGGKTLAATALIAYLSNTARAKCAFLTETVAEVETAYRRLIKLVPAGMVAPWTWAHDKCADQFEVEQKVLEDDIEGGIWS